MLLLTASCCRMYRAWGVDGISNGEPNPCQRGPENVSLANNTGPCDPDEVSWWTYYCERSNNANDMHACHLLTRTRRCAGQEGRHPYYSALPAGDGADMLPALYRKPPLPPRPGLHSCQSLSVNLADRGLCRYDPCPQGPRAQLGEQHSCGGSQPPA